MKHRMIVTKVFRPRGSGGPENKLGDEFDATDAQRKLWKALKWAEDAPEKPKVIEPPKYQTKVVEPEPVPAYKRSYRRRDMTAETPE